MAKGLALAQAADPAIEAARQKFAAAADASWRARDAGELARAESDEALARFELRQARLRALFGRIEGIRRGAVRLQERAEALQPDLFSLPPIYPDGRPFPRAVFERAAAEGRAQVSNFAWALAEGREIGGAE